MKKPKKPAEPVPRARSTAVVPTEQRSVFSGVTRFFTSVRTTVTLLFLLAAASIPGTVIPQDLSLEQLRQASSSFAFRLIIILDLHNVYRSWWFLLLLIFLALNLLGCLIQRLPAIPGEWRASSGRNSFSFTVASRKTLAELRDLIHGGVSPLVRSSPRCVESEEGVGLIWVKDLIHLLGFPLIHSAVILILLGALIGLLYGFKGTIQIREGEAEDRFLLASSGKSGTLPFQIAVDRFSLTRYPTGEPKEFRSDVRLLKDGKEELAGSIRVNHPLTLHGISLYQSDYRLGLKEVRFGVADASGKETTLSLRPHAQGQIPGTRYRARLLRLDPGETEKGSWVELAVESAGEEPRMIKLYRQGAAPVRLGDLTVRFLDYATQDTTVLQIGYDPGTPVVWVGCGLLITGFLLALFTNYRRLHVEIKSTRDGAAIHVSGRSRRARREFRQAVEERIKELANPSPS